MFNNVFIEDVLSPRSAGIAFNILFEITITRFIKFYIRVTTTMEPHPRHLTIPEIVHKYWFVFHYFIMTSCIALNKVVNSFNGLIHCDNLIMVLTIVKGVRESQNKRIRLVLFYIYLPIGIYVYEANIVTNITYT